MKCDETRLVTTSRRTNAGVLALTPPRRIARYTSGTNRAAALEGSAVFFELEDLSSARRGARLRRGS